MCTLGTLAEKWNQNYKGEVEHYTFDSYRAPLKDVLGYFGDRDANDILPKDIKNFLATLAETGKARQTICLRLFTLRHLYRYGVIEGLIQSNPTEVVEVPRNLPKGKRDIAPDAAIEAVKKAKPDNQFWILAKCLLYLGVRKGEALALSKDSLDFERNIVRINKQVEFHKGFPVIKHKAKTKSGHREVVLPQVLRKELMAFCKVRQNYLFVSEAGELLKNSEARQGWDALGLGATMHQFRHAYATILYEAGVDEKVAQRLMGHASILTTRNIYTHIREARLDKAAAQINEFLLIA